jgi:hypothetical protein
MLDARAAHGEAQTTQAWICLSLPDVLPPVTAHWVGTTPATVPPPPAGALCTIDIAWDTFATHCAPPPMARSPPLQAAKALFVLLLATVAGLPVRTITLVAPAAPVAPRGPSGPRSPAGRAPLKSLTRSPDTSALLIAHSAR